MLLHHGGIRATHRFFNDEHGRGVRSRTRRRGGSRRKQRNELRASHRRETSDCVGHGVRCIRLGKIGTLRMYGEPIPHGWLLDDKGQPTDDPGKSRLLAPAAGPRGYGLALVMGILAGPLCGGLMASSKDNDPSEHFFMAINIASFTDYDTYVAELQQGIDKIHTSKTAEGVEQAFLPGEIEWNNYDKWRESGIPIHRNHLQSLADIADRLNVAIFWKW